jgi:hypothetical protein
MSTTLCHLTHFEANPQVRSIALEQGVRTGRSRYVERKGKLVYGRRMFKILRFNSGQCRSW